MRARARHKRIHMRAHWHTPTAQSLIHTLTPLTHQPVSEYYPAEDYHQMYLAKVGDTPVTR